MKRLTTDVVVLGAGPAGSVFASRLLQLGFSACLVERAPFPRPRLGESLSPGVLPMLASVGLAETVDSLSFPRISAVSTNWHGEEDIREDPLAQGMLVDRGAFDAALLGRAEALGARVLQPARVLHWADRRGGFRVGVDAPTGPIEIHASFLADARGRSARSSHRRTMGPRTFAIYGYWSGTRLPRRPRIEAGEREWYWGVPIPDGSYNTLVFVDGGRFRSEPYESLEDRLRSLLERSKLMREVRDATLRGPARAIDATPYIDEDCVGARHIKLGDAAIAIDPLSSSGVQKAIQTALSGAIVANTLLRRPDARGEAQGFYRDSLNDAAAQHRTWARRHYAAAAEHRRDLFWTERAEGATPEAHAGMLEPRPEPGPTLADDVPVKVSPHVRWEALPCLQADFVEVRSAIRHPHLDGPVAYLAGHELAGLLRQVRPGMTTSELAQAWSHELPMGTGLSIARWLSGRGVLERF